jgi:hypothetical protein
LDFLLGSQQSQPLSAAAISGRDLSVVYWQYRGSEPRDSAQTKNVTVTMGEVTGVDKAHKCVFVSAADPTQIPTVQRTLPSTYPQQSKSARIMRFLS